MWQAIKHQTARLGGRALIHRARPRDASLRLTLPDPNGGANWVTATVALSSRPRGMGETLRVRGHIDSCFRMPASDRDRGALPRDGGVGASPLLHYGRRAAASLARRAFARLPPAARTRLAEQRRRGWLDLQISTAPLDGGAAALMPEPLRAVYGDRLPQAGPGGPRVGVWSGPAGGRLGGMARLAMVQFDSGMLDVDRSSDDDRFSLSLSIAELAEPAVDDAEWDGSTAD